MNPLKKHSPRPHDVFGQWHGYFFPFFLGFFFLAGLGAGGVVLKARGCVPVLKIS